jgi:predicted HicB family RNase H-like nuclease
MNTMSFRNYLASVEYDPDDKIFVGHIVGIQAIVSFHGSSVEELEAAFHDAVNHYLEVCEKIGQMPQRSYSGKLPLRLAPEVYMATDASHDEKSTSAVADVPVPQVR